MITEQAKISNLKINIKLTNLLYLTQGVIYRVKMNEHQAKSTMNTSKQAENL